MPTRRDTIFVGGEILDDNSGIQGTSFYNTIKDMPVLGATYRLAQDKVFDIYDQARNVISYFTKLLQYLHNGVLPTYVVWCLLGMIGMFLIMFR
jgi:hypothetical protein